VEIEGEAEPSEPAHCDGRYDLESVVAHEVGHFFGLGEDMADAEATMYFRTSRCDLGKRVIGPADAAELAVLYAELPDESAERAQAGTARGCSAGPPGSR
jgi:hypothetical protein